MTTNHNTAGMTAMASGSGGERQQEAPGGLKGRWPIFGVCIFLAVITLAVFGQTFRHEFVNYDDDLYVYENPAVTRGLTLEGIEWAFTHVVASNWHPLTMMSHMLDCRLYGLEAGEHHLTNVLLHTASAMLLFLVLRRMTGVQWGSAFVAAVFAIHPLHVESVAWVAERKDVLSGLFFMLTLWAYERYVRHPFSPGRYLLVVLLFTLGLLSKPMLVTLPFMLLLLDYWPLKRFTTPAPTGAVTGNVDHTKHLSIPLRLIVEKIPMLALSGAACVATLMAQKEAVVSVPTSLRIDSAVASYVVYLRQMFCPTGLAVFYPYPRISHPFWEIALAFILLASISTGVFSWRQRHPYLLMGWLWYLGMLVPVIGLVQVGMQSHADRYTYLPQIGLYLALTWMAGSLCAGWRCRRLVLGVAAAIVITALSVVSFIQTSYWRNSESLWTHTVACTPNNADACNNLGNALFQKGLVDKAIAYYQKALEVQPDSAKAHYNMGNAMLQKGLVDEAIVHYQKAVAIQPDYVLDHINLGNALLQKGLVDEAIIHYQKAVAIQPDYMLGHINLGNALLQKGLVDEAIAHFQTALADGFEPLIVHYNLGIALLRKGRVDEAIVHFQKALQIEPGDAETHNNLGMALLQKGRLDEAVIQFQKAMEIQPTLVGGYNCLRNMAWVLATSPKASDRNGAKAVELAEQAERLSGGGNPAITMTLAAAYAEAGRFPEAVATAQRAQQSALAQNQIPLVHDIKVQIGLYQAGIPFHEASQTNVPAHSR